MKKLISLDPDTNKPLEREWVNLFVKKYREGSYTFAARDGGLMHGEKTPDAVIIVAAKLNPLAPQDDKLVLIKEFRPAVGDYEYGFPAGLIDKGETAEVAAIREFKEETGMDLHITYVSPPNLYSSAGLTNETVQFVFGKAYGTVSKNKQEPSEDIEVMFASIGDIWKLSSSMNAMGAKAWPFLFFFERLGKFDILGG